MANTKLKEVQDQLPATTSTFEEDSWQYQENLTADDQSIPFLKIAAKADEEIGAKEGDAYNSVTGVVYSKETDIEKKESTMRSFEKLVKAIEKISTLSDTYIIDTAKY